MRNNRAGSLSHSTMTTCCLPIVRSPLVSQEDNKKQEIDMTYCIHLTWKLLKSILQNVYFQWQSTNYADAITSPCECLTYTDPPLFFFVPWAPAQGWSLSVEHLLLHFIHLTELRRHTRYVPGVTEGCDTGSDLRVCLCTGEMDI